MNDLESLDMQDQAEIDGQSSGFPGHLLRQAREEMGLSQKEAARDLHLTSKVINAIEQSDFTIIPSSVFARGYIRSYARHVGLDGQALVGAFDITYGVPNNSAKPRSAVQKLGRQSKPSDTWVKLVSIAFVIGLLVASIVWWQSQNGSLIPSQLANTATEVTGGDTLDDTSTLEQGGLDLSLLVANEGDVEASVPLEQAQAVVDEVVESTSEQAPAVVPAIVDEPSAAPIVEQVVPLVVEEAAAVLAPNEAQLVMVFDKDCWVEIKDGNGKMILSDLYSAGDTIAQAVTAPIEVLLGRSSGVEKITFDGRLIDLEPYTRKDIARLTLSK
ncbi:MAG: helix-turn-helix domain-containing protein [Oceanospirillaceae bacterium]|nr:helix-turn-helix domain-containing protein [Oceanospirillaceae bacterium]